MKRTSLLMSQELPSRISPTVQMKSGRDNHRWLIRSAAALCLIAACSALLTGCSKEKVVRQAYTYGYPLVTMELTRRQETNVREPDDSHAPMGQLIKLRSYPAVD